MDEQKSIIGKIIIREKVKYGNDMRIVADIMPGDDSDTQKCDICQNALQAVTVILISAISDVGVGMPANIWWCPRCKEQR